MKDECKGLSVFSEDHFKIDSCISPLPSEISSIDKSSSDKNLTDSTPITTELLFPVRQETSRYKNLTELIDSAFPTPELSFTTPSEETSDKNLADSAPVTSGLSITPRPQESKDKNLKDLNFMTVKTRSEASQDKNFADSALITSEPSFPGRPQKSSRKYFSDPDFINDAQSIELIDGFKVQKHKYGVMYSFNDDGIQRSLIFCNKIC